MGVGPGRGGRCGHGWRADHVPDVRSRPLQAQAKGLQERGCLFADRKSGVGYLRYPRVSGNQRIGVDEVETPAPQHFEGIAQTHGRDKRVIGSRRGRCSTHPRAATEHPGEECRPENPG